MQKQEGEKIVNQYLEAISNSDVRGVMSLYANNCSVEDPVGSEPHEGYAAVKAFYSNIENVNIKAVLMSPVRVTDAGNALSFAFQVKVDMGESTLIQDVIDVFYCDENNKIIKMQAFWGSENATMQ